jgi:hypothetical protein
MDLACRGRGLFDVILDRRREADLEVSLQAADAWLLASMPVAARA